MGVSGAGSTFEIRMALPDVQPVTKIGFGCLRCEYFVEALNKTQRKTPILPGIELHICVVETPLAALRHYSLHAVVVSPDSPNSNFQPGLVFRGKVIC